MGISIFIRKCRNGYYIRIFRSFWQWTPDRLVAANEEEAALAIADYLEKKGEA